jgi:hypothetical protein
LRSSVKWTDDNYKGVLAVEIAGATTAAHIGNSMNIQDGIASGSNNVKTGGVVLPAASTSALLVTLTMDTNGGGRLALEFLAQSDTVGTRRPEEFVVSALVGCA